MNLKKLSCFLVSAVFVVANLSSSICHAAMADGNHNSSQSDQSSAQISSQSSSQTSKSGKIRLLAISGSERKESANTKALNLLSKAATTAGASVTTINLKDYPLPIYNGDLESEQGLPANAKKLQALIAEHDGLLIASPEYNGLPSPLLKNVFDWASRPDQNNPHSGIKIFEGKVAALISASPSPMGGIRGSAITAQLLSNIGLIVVPDRVAIANAPTAFNASGDLNDAVVAAMLKKEAVTATRLAQALKNMQHMQ